jgi:hypothetical protein
MPAKLVRHILLFLLILPAAPALARELVLEPTSKWYLNYDDDSCRMTRTFGEGDDKVMLLLDWVEPTSKMKVSVIGQPFGHLPNDFFPISLNFGPNLPKAKPASALATSIGTDGQPMLIFVPRDLLNREKKGPDPTTAQEAAVTEMSIVFERRRITLLTGSMAEPLKAKRACTDDLVRRWGIDPAQAATLRSAATPLTNPRRWLQAKDFPINVMSKGASADVHLRLMIDASGNPSECHVQRATNAPELTQLVCQLMMKRARFKPAIDSTGKPVATYFIRSSVWLVER